MAEIRKIDYDKIAVRCETEGKDFIPNNWYIPARKAWQVFAWALIQIKNGATIRTSNEVDRFIHRYWEYIEDHAMSIGEEDGITESNS